MNSITLTSIIKNTTNEQGRGMTMIKQRKETTKIEEKRCSDPNFRVTTKTRVYKGVGRE
jgi:hypothetical protein